MISSNTFWRTVICGFIATFIMAMVSFLQSGLGLPPIDIAYLIDQSLNHVHGTEVYSISWANTAYIIGGILLALFWVVFLHNRIPGNWIVKGIIFGILISIFSGAVVSPLVSAAAGDSFGLFYTNTWFPGKLLLAGIIMHLSYGISLLLCLKIAGVKGLDSAS
ncbi:hypothetical protein [Rhodohalobacter sp.]|uniref:hypothetical protein n=1 Tax=Rhodohalobacter sp. TaxID=1974210 RepID=UPI002ACE95E6|nr:hypothetical protein [Rhodohalobacter sp.]MDZ7757874.1 hypothetical protein [Rhodohalobacter sp.]